MFYEQTMENDKLLIRCMRKKVKIINALLKNIIEVTVL